MTDAFDLRYRDLCAGLGDLLLKKEAVDAEVAKIRFALKKLVEEKQAHAEQMKKVDVVKEEAV